MSPVSGAVGKVTGHGVVLVLYPGDATYWIQIERAPDVAGDPDELAIEILGKVAPGSRHFVHTQEPTTAFAHYRALHVQDGYTDGNPTAWIRARPQKLPDDIPNLISLQPTKPLVDFDLFLNTETGAVTITVDGEPEVGSVKWAHSTTDWPVSGAGTAVDTDASGDVTIADAFTLTGGETGYVRVSFYSGAGGTGSLLGTLRQSITYHGLFAGEPGGHDWEFGGDFRDVPHLMWEMPADTSGIESIEIRQGTVWATANGGVFNPGFQHVFRGKTSEWKATWEQVLANPSRSYTFVMMAHFHNGTDSAMQGPVTVTNAAPNAAGLTVIDWDIWGRMMGVTVEGILASGATFVEIHRKAQSGTFTPDETTKVGEKNVDYAGSGTNREVIYEEKPVEDTVAVGDDLRHIIRLGDELTALLGDWSQKDLGVMSFGRISREDGGAPLIFRDVILDFPPSTKYPGVTIDCDDIFIYEPGGVVVAIYQYDCATLTWKKTGALSLGELSDGDRVDDVESGTVNYTTLGAPTNNPVPTGITIHNRAGGTRDVFFTFTYTQGAKPADRFYLYYDDDQDALTSLDPKHTLDPAVRSTWKIGLPQNQAFRFGIAAARLTNAGVEIGTIVQPTSAPDWRVNSTDVIITTGSVKIDQTVLIDGETAAGVRTGAQSGAALVTAGAGSVQRLGDQRRLPQIQAAGRVSAPTGYSGALLSATPTQITVAAFTVQYGGFSISYPGGTISGLSASTRYHVYVDDGTYAGGSSSFVATTNWENLLASTNRIHVGTITTPSTGTSTGNPGGGYCVAADMYVAPGKRAADVQVGDLLRTLSGDGRRGEFGIVEVVHPVVVRDCVRLTNRWKAAVVVSKETPLTLADGSLVHAEHADGLVVASIIRGAMQWGRVTVEAVGERAVVPINVGDRCFAAGESAERMILTHNTDEPKGGLE